MGKRELKKHERREKLILLKKENSETSRIGRPGLKLRKSGNRSKSNSKRKMQSLLPRRLARLQHGTRLRHRLFALVRMMTLTNQSSCKAVQAFRHRFLISLSVDLCRHCWAFFKPAYCM